MRHFIFVTLKVSFKLAVHVFVNLFVGCDKYVKKNNKQKSETPYTLSTFFHKLYVL